MDTIATIKAELDKHVNFEKADYLPKFFKAFPGGYGEGDQFLGVKVPDQRKVARQFWKEVSKKELVKLLHDPIHEVRLCAVFMLVLKFERAKKPEDKEKWVNVYLNNLEGINNWDLVDSSAHQIIGSWLYDKPRELLTEFAFSDDLWKQRIAMIATYHFIKKDDFETTLEDCGQILLHHEHDLIHKAVGWMLREAGNRNKNVEVDFLNQHYKTMPRTALRYAIEKFPEPERKAYLKGEI